MHRWKKSPTGSSSPWVALKKSSHRIASVDEHRTKCERAWKACWGVKAHHWLYVYLESTAHCTPTTQLRRMCNTASVCDNSHCCSQACMARRQDLKAAGVIWSWHFSGIQTAAGWLPTFHEATQACSDCNSCRRAIGMTLTWGGLKAALGDRVDLCILEVGREGLRDRGIASTHCMKGVLNE